jgi:hypothetical protein
MTYYTYLWLREDGTPYYVGKGSGNRCVGPHKRIGVAPSEDRILTQEFPSESDAFEAEKFFISLYGRKDLGTGCLANLTDGGEGPSGHTGNRGKVRTEATKLLLRQIATEQMKNTPHSQEVREICRQKAFEQWRSGVGPSVKISASDVLEIRQLYKQNWRQATIAKKFGTTQQQVSKICSGQSRSSVKQGAL